MTRRRTTARGGLLLILAALFGLALAGSPGAALEAKPGLVDGQPIVFPLIGDYAYTMNFGDPRGQGAHEGIDIEHVPWRTPVVAAESGTVKWWTTSWRAGCMLYLYGKSGTTYLYIHLNNDLTVASEDKGGCKAGVSYAVSNGAKVSAGEQIAWSGDSGDAEGNFHLHFEVHPNDGPAVNPYPYLNEGERLLFPGRLGAAYSLGLRGTPIGAGEGMLRLRATAVRWWPGGQWTSLVRDRIVTLEVAGDAEVDDTLAAALHAPAFATLQASASTAVTAFTARGAVTAAALRGKPGTLVASRVTRPGGLTVAMGSGDPADPLGDAISDDTSAPDVQDGGLPNGV
ncbi:MAG TPA: M23 family metallopeptidase [Gaiella sp.]|jgi:hypothetical protein